MNGARVAGWQLAGQLVRDRETGKAYALHNACADTLRDALGAHEYLARMAPMGPVAPGTSCDLAACGRVIGTDN